MGILIENITQSVGGPWQEIDGEGGTMEVFWPTLDLVVRQTQPRQDDIAKLLGDLRQVPFVAGPAAGLRMAEPMSLPRDKFYAANLGAFQNLIQDTTGGPPDGPWTENDGEGGNFTYDRARLTLGIKQTAAVHEEVYSLLTQLRRSRYRTAREDRPWEMQHTAEGRQPWLGSPEITRLTAMDRKDQKSQGTREEQELLRVRSESGSGAWTVRRLTAEGREIDVIQLRKDPQRLEWNWGGVRIKTEGDQAAIAHPVILLVELGNWGEAARLALDTLFP